MLGDHYKEGGEYLRTGWHKVRITGVRMIEHGDGGVEYQLENKSGKSKVAFWLNDKQAWVLANFAKACGLTVEEMAKFNESAEAHHKKMMVGRDVQVYVSKDGKYHQVQSDLDCWVPFDADTPPPPFGPTQETATVGVAQTDDGVIAGEDIPF